jgi:hypothetical protein
MFTAAGRLQRQLIAAKRRIIGTDTAGTSNLTAGYVLYQKFTASESASCTELQSYCLVNSNIILGIYTDNAGRPSTLLNQSASTAATAGRWVAAAIPATSLVSGTTYWLAVTCSVTGGCSHTSPANSGQYEYQARSFQALPATAASTSYTNYLVAVRGMA